MVDIRSRLLTERNFFPFSSYERDGWPRRARELFTFEKCTFSRPMDFHVAHKPLITILLPFFSFFSPFFFFFFCIGEYLTRHRFLKNRRKPEWKSDICPCKFENHPRAVWQICFQNKTPITTIGRNIFNIIGRHRIKGGIEVTEAKYR